MENIFRRNCTENTTNRENIIKWLTQTLLQPQWDESLLIALGGICCEASWRFRSLRLVEEPALVIYGGANGGWGVFSCFWFTFVKTFVIVTRSFEKNFVVQRYKEDWKGAWSYNNWKRSKILGRSPRKAFITKNSLSHFSTLNIKRGSVSIVLPLQMQIPFLLGLLHSQWQ